ncbi:hypothetical protein [Thermosulfuriphilus sp.]
MFGRSLGILMLAVLLGGCASTTGLQPQDARVDQKAPVTVLVKLSVEGADYPTLKRLKERLLGLPGVHKVYQKSFNAQGVSHLEIDYEGLTQTLADAIQGLSSPEMAIDVLKFDPAQIVIRISQVAPTH